MVGNTITCSFAPSVFRFSSPSVRLSSVVVLSLELIPDLAEIFDLSSGFCLSLDRSSTTNNYPSAESHRHPKNGSFVYLFLCFCCSYIAIEVAFVLSDEQVSFFLNWGLNLGLVGML